jgi:hypothetical protein
MCIILSLALIVCALAGFGISQRTNSITTPQAAAPLVAVGAPEIQNGHDYTIVLPTDKLRGKAPIAAQQEPPKIVESPKPVPIISPPAVEVQSKLPKTEEDGVDLVSLQTKMTGMIEELRNMKFIQDIVMETDATAQAKIKETQAVIRQFLVQKYGPDPYRVEMKLQFPASMPPPAPLAPGQSDVATIVIELAPIEHVPYSVYFFLENIVRVFKTGAFHRNAGHVLQAMLHGKEPNEEEGIFGRANFAWQEYSPQFPHKKFTLGYAGRPSGSSAIYISTVDNTHNHGPASQGSKSEADRSVSDRLRCHEFWSCHVTLRLLLLLLLLLLSVFVVC